MSEGLEKLEAILSKVLPDSEVQALIADLTMASGKGAVAIAGDAPESVILTGNDNTIDNHVVIIKQNSEPEELIGMIHVIRSLLQEIQQVGSTPLPRTPFQQFPEVSQFDLTQLVDRSLGELLGRQGLIGLAIPCGEKAFLKNFCDRLKQDLGRSNVQIRQTLSLNPQVTSVNRAVGSIKLYKKLLQTNDVICPIRVGVCDPNSNIPKDFWQQIQEAFRDNFQYRLIIIMAGTYDCVFPPDTVLLNPPQFTRVHAFQWIRDITRALNWMHLNEVWHQKMVTHCLCDETQQELLDIGLVYEHLDYTLTLLRRDPTLSAEAFLEQLD